MSATRQVLALEASKQEIPVLTSLTILALASLAQPEAPAAKAAPAAQTTRQQQPLALDEVVRVYSLAGIQMHAEDPITSPSSFAHGLARVMGLRSEVLNALAVAVRGTTQQHEAFAQTIEQLRQSSAVRYRVDLAAVIVSGPAPRVGSTIESIPAPEVRLDRVVAQRATSPVVAVRMQSHIETWRTIVSDGATGYEPSVGTAWSGLRASLTVDDAGAESVIVRLEGAFRRSTVTSIQLPLVPAGTAAAQGHIATIGLPQVDERSIDSSTRIRLGQATVLTSTSGFEPGTSFMIIATIERAE